MGKGTALYGEGRRRSWPWRDLCGWSYMGGGESNLVGCHAEHLLLALRVQKGTLGILCEV